MTPGHEEALRALRLADRALSRSGRCLTPRKCRWHPPAFLHSRPLQEHDVAVPCSADELRKLNSFAVTFRYDDTDIPIVSGTEIETMVDTMRRWAGEAVK